MNVSPQNDSMLREDNSMLSLMHYAQLLNFVAFMGLIVPIVLWSSKKTEIKDMDIHGKHVVNFQLSMLIYTLALGLLFLISFVLMFFVVGFILMFLVSLLAIGLALLLIIPPILGGMAASKGRLYKYPLTINFIH